MKIFLTLIALMLASSAQAASTAISGLTATTSPSTNTFIEVADMDAATKSVKYLLTNLVTQSSLNSKSSLLDPPLNFSGTSVDLSLTNRWFSKSLGANTTLTFANPTAGRSFSVILTNGASWTITFPTVTWMSGSAPVLDVGAGKVNVFSFYYDGTTYYGDVSQNASAILNSIAALANGTGALTNNGSGTFGYYNYSTDIALKAPLASPTFTGTATAPTAAIATATIGAVTLTNNLGSIESVGNTNVVDFALTSGAVMTNEITAAITFAHATNGVDGLLTTKIRKFVVPSGGPYTLVIPTGWRTNVYSAVPPALTNSCVTWMYLKCDGPTSSSALQTNVYVSFEYYK